MDAIFFAKSTGQDSCKILWWFFDRSFCPAPEIHQCLSTKQKPKLALVADPMAIDQWLSRYDADAMIYGHVHKLAHYRSAQNPYKISFCT